MSATTLELTAEQRAAVDLRRGPVQLSAAAGSGKTAVLVERFAMAVLADGLPVGKILAITFTERAANELRERLRARLHALDQPLAAHETEAALIGTFHGLCARLLRSHPLAAGVDPAFTILDEPLAAQLRGLAFRDARSPSSAGARSRRGRPARRAGDGRGARDGPERVRRASHSRPR